MTSARSSAIRAFLLAVSIAFGAACTADGSIGSGGGASTPPPSPWGPEEPPRTPVPPSFPDAPAGSDGDADDDGLSDDRERALGTDPTDPDTDGDMVTDLGETAAGTDPRDPASTIRPQDFFVVLPYNGPHERRTLTFGSSISMADVYFLIDTTDSMMPTIANVRASLGTLATEIGGAIPDVAMGVGYFEDFPCCETEEWEWEDPLGYYGGHGDSPYTNVQDITTDSAAVQRALDSLYTRDGGDWPESGTQALYLTATGEGIAWGGPNPRGIPTRTCPSIPDEPGTRRGYPCFRAGALPIIVHVTDIETHNGPSGTNAYYDGDIGMRTHTFDDAVGALNRIGARVIGVAVDGGGRSDLDAFAMATGSVDGAGRPLTQSAPAGSVSSAVADAILALAGGTPQNVSTRTENLPGNPGELDATQFIASIVPVEGIRDGVRGTGYASKDATSFMSVIPGTLLEFDVDFANTVRPPPATAEVFRAQILVVGNGVATLDTRTAIIIVPPDGSFIEPELF